MILSPADAAILLPDIAADPRLSFWVNQADTALRRWTDRDRLERGPVVESIDGAGLNRVWLREWPVSEVASVALDGSPLAPGTWTLALNEDVQAQLRRGPAPAPLDPLCGPRWSVGHRNITVAYTAGYDPIPPDLQAAAAFLVRYFQGLMTASLAGPQDKKVKHRDHEIERFGPADVLAGRSLPPFAEGLAEPYRRK